MKKIKIFFLAFGFLISVISAGFVCANDTPPNVSDIYRNCMNAGAKSEVSLCLSRAAKEVEKYLGALEREISRAPYSGNDKYFHDTSVAWKSLVESTCKLDSDESEGKFTGHIYDGCKINLLSVRIKYLKKYRYCVSGGDCEKPIMLYPKMLGDN